MHALTPLFVCMLVWVCVCMIFSHYRSYSCWDRPALCSGAAWHDDTPPAPTSWCWISCLPASSPYPAPDPHLEAQALSVATIACTHTQKRIKQSKTYMLFFLTHMHTVFDAQGTFSNHTAPFHLTLFSTLFHAWFIWPIYCSLFFDTGCEVHKKCLRKVDS